LLCEALEKVLALPPMLRRETTAAVYECLALMPAFDNMAAAREEAGRIYREKVAKGLL